MTTTHIIRDEPHLGCSALDYFDLCPTCRERIIVGPYLEDRPNSVGDHYRAFLLLARDYVQNFRAWYTDSASY